MLEKLKEIALRYEDLQAQLGDSAIYGDSARLASVTREQVAAAARRLELDTVYFLKGQED